MNINPDISALKSNIETLLSKGMDTKEKKAAALSLLVAGAALTAFVSLSLALAAVTYPLLAISTALLVGWAITLSVYVAKGILTDTEHPAVAAEATVVTAEKHDQWKEEGADPKERRSGFNPFALPPDALENALDSFNNHPPGRLPFSRQYS